MLISSNKHNYNSTEGQDSFINDNNLQYLKLQRQNIENYLDVTDSCVSLDRFTVHYYDIFATCISIISRVTTIYLNIKLVYDYNQNGNKDFAIWTTICIVLPMIITSLIYANMCYQDGKFKNGFSIDFSKFFSLALIAFLFRYWNVFVYSVKCKRAESRNAEEEQKNYYKATLKEESDVAFIRLFECFLETSPQKILIISIILSQKYEIHYIQIITLCTYFLGMAWCLTVYNRSIRYAQIDKYHIKLKGHISQLCWHFCISVSRTLSISFMSNIYPLLTILCCIGHSFILGFLTYVLDRPKFANSNLCNFLFSLTIGFVYLFTYIPVRDKPTFRKYLLYYAISLLEIILCIYIFYMQYNRSSILFSFFSMLCFSPIFFYITGIIFMIIYYKYYHPRIVARKFMYINSNEK